MSSTSAKWPSQRATYENLFAKMRDAVVLLDSESFDILDANSAAERLLGQNREGLHGGSLSPWVRPEHWDAFLQALRIARRRYHSHKFNCVWQRNSTDAKMVMELSICLLRLKDGTEVLQIIAKDLTRMAEAEEKLANYLRELQELNSRLAVLSSTDEMTGLSNFRSFKEHLEQEHRRAVRYNLEYAIVFCDLDHFKHYNDRNGHPAGDALLRAIAEILKNSCRATDFPARYGGEEFVILCPETRGDNAMALAERIRNEIEQSPLQHAENQPLGKVTVSIGVSSFPAAGKSAQAVLKAADDALYVSKKAGRNRVTLQNQLKDPHV